MYPIYNQSRGDELKVVNNRTSAEQYMMYPNSRVILLDSTQDRFYLKETDAAGMARITAYDFVKATDDIPANQDYVTRQELEELIKEYELNTSKSTNATISAKF